MQNAMYRELKSDLKLISKVVYGQIDLIRESLKTPQSMDHLNIIEDSENIIDSIELKIRSEVISSIVLYAPRAIDLRKIIAYYDINSYMERIGDHIYNISKALKNINYESQSYLSSIDQILDMLTKVETMVKNAMLATITYNNTLSQSTILSDDEVDLVKDQLTSSLVNVSDPNEFKTAMLLVQITSIIERIGDAATSVAKSALYITEGIDYRHDENVILPNE